MNQLISIQILLSIMDMGCNVEVSHYKVRKLILTKRVVEQVIVDAIKSFGEAEVHLSPYSMIVILHTLHNSHIIRAR